MVRPKQIGSLTLYSVDELSELLDVQDKTIRAYLKQGKLHGRKMAGKWYVTETQLRAYFENGSSTPAPAPKSRQKVGQA